MGLYLIEHTHTADKCPRQSLATARQFFDHLTEANAAKFGVRIVADWNNADDHHLVLIVEAPDQPTVAKFANPLATVGSVMIHEGTTCAETAERTFAAVSKAA